MNILANLIGGIIGIGAVFVIPLLVLLPGYGLSGVAGVERLFNKKDRVTSPALTVMFLAVF